MNLPEKTEDYAQFNRLMDEIMATIGRRRLVLLVDEYEIIEAKVTDGKVDREIFNYLDSLLIWHPRLSYVFTGSKDLEHNISWNALLSKTVCREISFLARKDRSDNPRPDRMPVRVTCNRWCRGSPPER